MDKRKLYIVLFVFFLALGVTLWSMFFVAKPQVYSVYARGDLVSITATGVSVQGSMTSQDFEGIDTEGLFAFNITETTEITKEDRIIRGEPIGFFMAETPRSSVSISEMVSMNLDDIISVSVYGDFINDTPGDANKIVIFTVPINVPE